jgi:uncharacterized protein DUF2784
LLIISCIHADEGIGEDLSMGFDFWADVILVIHFLYVLGVVVPVPLILLGGIFRWDFIRNSWFRNIHAAMMGIVVIEVLLGQFCPLTTWEYVLRHMGEVKEIPASFIQYWVSRVIFFDFPPQVFTIAYFVWFFLIGLLYFVFPPRWLLRGKGLR